VTSIAYIYIAAMAVVLVAIAGVVSALRRPSSGKQRAVDAVQDFATQDLHDRLAKITLTSPATASPVHDVVISPVEDDDDPLKGYQAAHHPAEDQPSGMATRLAGLNRRADLPPTQPAIGAPAAPPAAADRTAPTRLTSAGGLSRLALPGRGGAPAVPASGSGPESGTSQTHVDPPAQGLDSLAAHFEGFDVAPPAMPTSASGPAASGAGPAGLPGRVAPSYGVFAALPGTTTEAEVPARRGLPGTVAEGQSPGDAQEQTRESVPEPSGQPAWEPPALPGKAVDVTRTAPARTPQAHDAANALDIRAILRGETLPRGLPGKVARGTAGLAPKATFTGGLVPPAGDPTAPLGALPFDAALLRGGLAEPAPPRMDVFGRPWSASAPGFGPAAFDELSARVPSSTAGSDLDATKPVDDFELPETGFETHVFSTTELIEGEPDDALGMGAPHDAESTIPLDYAGGDTTAPLPDDEVAPALPHGVRSYDAPVMPAQPPSTPPSPAGIEDRLRSILSFGPPAAAGRAATGDVVPAPVRVTPAIDPAVLASPLQQTRASDLLSDLAALADVVFVKLISPEGACLVNMGSENGDFALDACIATIMKDTTGEARAHDLGEPNYLALESDRAALLVAPVFGGVTLAVYVSNPSRLGLLRRQVRKPVSGLHALLMESRVS
jgi:predicted regulator of Ras-like GTPase activity (Roadblock/LC7/MglB family)